VFTITIRRENIKQKLHVDAENDAKRQVYRVQQDAAIVITKKGRTGTKIAR
jgi:hypothetical protein